MILKRVLIIALLGSLAVGAFFGTRKIVDLTANRSKMFGEETLVQRGFTPFGQWGKRDTERRERSREVLVIGAEEVRIVKDTDFFQEGDIIVNDSGKLIFENSVVEMSPRANIFVRDKGEIVFENSTLKPHSDDLRNLYVNLSGEGKFVFNDSQGIHMLIASESAEIEMNNSTWAFYLPDFRGGGVRVRDAARANIANSTIGGLAVEFPRDARVDIRDFEAGEFDEFNMKKDFNLRNVDFNVVLENTKILGDYYEGGGERGLSIFAPSGIRELKISDSELNKFVLVSTDENIGFDGLKLGAAQDFSYGNIRLINSKVTSQWGFFMHGGRGTFTNSKGLWFSIYDDAELALKNSEMNRFDPRDFRGVIDFENTIWKNAGAIIGNNDFTWRGSWFAQGFDHEDFQPLIWDDSRVSREFFLDVLGLDPEPMFVSAAKVEVFDRDDKLLSEAYTNNTGRAEFSILFDDTNYKEKFTVKVTKGDGEIKYSVDFLTPTPIKLILK